MSHDDGLSLVWIGLLGMLYPRLGYAVMILYGVAIIIGHPVSGR